MKQTTKVIKEYEVLRMVVTVLVIIGHCTYISIVTPYGGVDYRTTFQSADVSMFLKLAWIVTEMIYNFHMPLFMALSGALFYNTLKKPGQNFFLLINSKAKRLLIPFVIVSLLYSIPLKWASGYYLASVNLIKDIFLGQIMVQGNTHLWFLPTLFLIFLCMYLVEKLVKGRYRILIWIILLFMSEASSQVPILLIQYVMQYSVWFYTGLCFEKHREAVNNMLTKKSAGCMIFLFFIGFVAQKMFVSGAYMGVKFMNQGFGLLETLLGMFSVYNIAYCLSNIDLCKYGVLEFFESDSFGLYLYSDSWNYVLLAVGYLAVGNKLFISNAYAVLFYFCRIIITTMIALAVTEGLKKLKLTCLY